MTDLPETIRVREGLSVLGASPALLKVLLDRLGDSLDNCGPELRQSLKPGSSHAVIAAAFHDAGLALPEEIAVWFSWHNGAVQDPTRSILALPRFEFWGLEQTLRAYHLADRGPAEWQWSDEWMQLTGGMAITLNGDGPPLIRNMELGVPPASQLEPHQVVSLCAPVSWWIDSIEMGRYRWDRERSQWTVAGMEAHPFERWMTGLI